MKYEYGVEYQCNGKKPDLPNGVLVEQLCGGNWYHLIKPVEAWVSWVNVTAFRIVDERYKPAEKPNALTSETSLTHSDSSLTHNWFERGELPPVGAICEIAHSGQEGKYRKIEILKYDDDRVACIDLCGDFDVYLGGLLWMYQIRDSDVKFRPIRTEREKAIEAAFTCLKNAGFDNDTTNTDYFHALYDAGLLRLREEK